MLHNHLESVMRVMFFFSIMVEIKPEVGQWTHEEVSLVNSCKKKLACVGQRDGWIKVCPNVFIHLIPKWRPTNYSFVCMFISPLCLVIVYKKQKNFEVKMRQRGLFI